MRKITVSLYQFDELSENAKEKAIEWLLTGYPDYDWWDCVFEDFQSIANILGFKTHYRDIFFSGFWSQGDGASFRADYAYNKNWKKELEDYAPCDSELFVIGNELQAIQKKHFYSLTASITKSGMYEHEYAMHADVEDSRGYEINDDSDSEILECARDLARRLYKQLENEYNYLTSKENAIESIRINEYEFTEDGNIA